MCDRACPDTQRPCSHLLHQIADLLELTPQVVVYVNQCCPDASCCGAYDLEGSSAGPVGRSDSSSTCTPLRRATGAGVGTTLNSRPRRGPVSRHFSRLPQRARRDAVPDALRGVRQLLVLPAATSAKRRMSSGSSDARMYVLIPSDSVSSASCSIHAASGPAGIRRRSRTAPEMLYSRRTAAVRPPSLHSSLVNDLVHPSQHFRRRIRTGRQPPVRKPPCHTQHPRLVGAQPDLHVVRRRRTALGARTPDSACPPGECHRPQASRPRE